MPKPVPDKPTGGALTPDKLREDKDLKARPVIPAGGALTPVKLVRSLKPKGALTPVKLARSLKPRLDVNMTDGGVQLPVN